MNDTQVIIKILKPVKKRKIKREIFILQKLSGHENIVNLIDIVLDPASKTPSLIFDKLDEVSPRLLFPKLSPFEIKLYMYQILKGLDHAHSNGIMHRDIKPHNLIIDPKLKLLKIIDWGLADLYFPNIEYSTRVASRYFKGPELLVDYRYYDYSLDMWSLGCLFAGIIFKKEPFFQGNDNFDQLVKIVKVLGSKGLMEYIDKYKVSLDSQYEGIIEEY